MDIGQVLDKITAYRNIIQQYSFEENGTGNLPWSHRYIGQGGLVLEISGSLWKTYDNVGDTIDMGTTPEELAVSFKLIYG